MLTLISGGTGSVKLLRGLKHATSEDLTIIANVGDNFWFHGLYITPDIDIVLYSLAGILDEAKGWGIRDDSFTFLNQLEKYGGDSWFHVGDRDLAAHILRTEMMKHGVNLSDIVATLSEKLGVKDNVLPATNQHMETRIQTDNGEMHLQEYWVKRQAKDSVLGVRYADSASAEPAPGVTEAIADSSGVILCPANPVTSIGPTIAIKKIRSALEEFNGPKIAVSPFIGDAPISGPAGKLMSSLGIKTSPIGVAKLYSSFLDTLVIDKTDSALKDAIESLNIGVELAGIMMNNREDEGKLAKFVLSLIH